jgi:hypothetical protein
METHCHIAVRLLLSKKRAMLMSLSGIVFGVGLFIVAVHRHPSADRRLRAIFNPHGLGDRRRVAR